ncbi:hypothetical protein [Sphingomonas sp. Leaf25]|uniref:hypothetical protein n=1 Tax=Sphingomonas sp. Leaf25 TaxID=1735692 RepID=UPI0006F3840B|nr:hypothetical protein [Sphingomonas sp. Leaf25]KQN03865.1 hypothetical protein ASE78_02000 [Sphingomonas sp. Leaf25]
MTTPASTSVLSRRHLLAGTTAIGGLFGIGAPIGAQPRFAKVPAKLPALFTAIPDGIKGPWGLVRATVIDGELCPFLIRSADGNGLFDFGGRMATIRLGDEATGLTLTAEGFAVGKDKPRPLKGNVAALVKLIRGNKGWTRSAMQLRSAYATAFPVLAAQKKQPVGKRQMATIGQVWDDLGSAANCTTTTITESVERRVRETVDVWMSAQERYAKCFDETVRDRDGACGWFGAGDPSFQPARVCAATYCVGKGFVDIVVGTITVWSTIVDEVTREVTECTAPLRGYLPDRFDLPTLPIPELKEPDFIRQIREGIMQSQDVLRAVQLLRRHLDGVLSELGPFRCFIEGEWSIAALPLVAGIGIPFGVNICIDAACARSLTLDRVGADTADALGTALSLLATFHSGVATALNIAPIAELATAVSGLGPMAVAAGAAIASLLIAAIYHAVVISAQLTLALRFSDVAADGKVCFHHPTLAAALLAAVTVGSLSPVLLTPPLIVN